MSRSLKQFESMMRVEDRSSFGEVTTPKEIVVEMLEQIPEHILKSSTTTFLDPCFGNGTFIIELIKKLRKYGHSMENIQGRIYGVEISNRLVNKVRRKLVKYNFDNIIQGDSLKKVFMNEKFDVQFFNPPFNLSSKSEDTVAGTSGNTTYYRKFIDRAVELKSENGIVGVICPRAGVTYANKKYGVSSYNPYTADHWKYDSGYFFINGDNSFKNIADDSILRKIYVMESQRPFSHAIGGSMKGKLVNGEVSLNDTSGVRGLINTPTAKEDKQYGYIHANAYVKEGPKVVFKGLESKVSYVVETGPHKVGSACTLYFDSVEEAEAALLFILNNPIMDYLMKKVFEKARGLVFRYIKSFDLSQIKTGYEIPSEFNLTEEEISLMNATV